MKNGPPNILCSARGFALRVLIASIALGVAALAKLSGRAWAIGGLAVSGLVIAGFVLLLNVAG